MVVVDNTASASPAGDVATSCVRIKGCHCDVFSIGDYRVFYGRRDSICSVGNLFTRHLNRRSRKVKTQDLKMWVIGLVIAALLFGNPMTRSIILWILPLGSGIDDLIFLALLILAVVAGLIYSRKKHNERENNEHKE